MLRIPCPWCGDRAEIEFLNGGEYVDRPPDPMALAQPEWSDYLFNRANHMGITSENWWHAHGCRQWFVLERDTSTNEFQSSAAAPQDK